MNSNKELLAKGYLVYTLTRAIHSFIEEDVKQDVKKYGLQYTGFRLLWILYYNKKMNMTELSSILQTNISNIYRQLNKLSNNNLVVIDTGQDARIKEVSLSVIGNELVSEILSNHSVITDLEIISALKKIPKDDLDKFLEVGSVLSTEFFGQCFTDWSLKMENKIKNH